MNKRSQQLELMDLGQYTPEEYHDCLFQLDRVGRLLGGDRATYWAFNQLKRSPTSILDVGCGGGLFTIKLAKRYPQAQVIGLDISQEAIQMANNQLATLTPPLSNVQFLTSLSPRLHYLKKSVDVITSTLVCHHMTDDALILFLKDSYAIAKQAIILNDLHRHLMAMIGFTALTPLFHNRLISHDGLLSIKRAFKRSDWVFYLKEAGIPLERCSITWHWAFRWIVFIDTEQ